MAIFKVAHVFASLRNLKNLIFVFALLGLAPELFPTWKAKNLIFVFQFGSLIEDNILQWLNVMTLDYHTMMTSR